MKNIATFAVLSKNLKFYFYLLFSYQQNDETIGDIAEIVAILSLFVYARDNKMYYSTFAYSNWKKLKSKKDVISLLRIEFTKFEEKKKLQNVITNEQTIKLSTYYVCMFKWSIMTNIIVDVRV